MKNTIKDILLQKGVSMPNPDSVFISDDVDPDRISVDGVTIYAGSKIVGEKSLIMPGTRIGYEGPATLENCIIGEDCDLKGGFFQGAVFMGRNQFGSGAHVRSGTILEEESNAAHTVGLKHTILFPFVTLGSLINFCDCFMAGGTSRKDHSEVGSSFIHFNYTPNQDKATPSMMGNVHQGVMLDQRPIFLGGQGGLVGPLRIGYGCITAAGSVVRKDEERPDRLVLGGGFKSVSLSWQPGVYSGVARIYNLNVRYIAALISLRSWYAHVRPLFGGTALSDQLILGLRGNLDLAIRERIKRFSAFIDKLALSRDTLAESRTPGKSAIRAHDQVLARAGGALERFDTALGMDGMTATGEAVVREVEAGIRNKGKAYITVIRHLDPAIKARGSQWLLEIENDICNTLEI